MSDVRLSARQVAAKFLATKSAKVRNELIADAQSRCEGKASSKKKRWERLASAMAANDVATVERYADFAAWSAKQTAAKAAAKPKAKAAAKPKASTKAKAAAKPARKAAPKAEPSPAELAKALGIDPDLMAAFLEVARK